MPTRFVKQLTQIVRGAVAIGMDRADAMRLAIRCARDSMPPLRLEILKDLAAHPDSTPSDVRKRLDQPHNTIDRELQALHILKLVTLSEKPCSNTSGGERTRWHYSLRDGTNATTVFPEMYVPPSPKRGCVGLHISLERVPRRVWPDEDRRPDESATPTPPFSTNSRHAPAAMSRLASRRDVNQSPQLGERSNS